MSRVTLEQRTAWANHIKQQPNSSFSQRAYCTHHNIDLRQFTYWKGVFEPTSAALNKRASKPSRTKKFVPVQMTNRVPSQSLTILLPNGISISGINADNQTLLPSLLGACQ